MKKIQCETKEFEDWTYRSERDRCGMNAPIFGFNQFMERMCNWIETPIHYDHMVYIKIKWMYNYQLWTDYEQLETRKIQTIWLSTYVHTQAHRMALFRWKTWHRFMCQRSKTMLNANWFAIKCGVFRIRSHCARCNAYFAKIMDLLSICDSISTIWTFQSTKSQSHFTQFKCSKLFPPKSDQSNEWSVAIH